MDQFGRSIMARSSPVDGVQSRPMGNIEKRRNPATAKPDRAGDRECTNAHATAASPFLGQLIRGPLTFEPNSGAKSLRVRKGKDVLIAGKHYESAYVNHDGWLFRYKILHNGSRQIVDFILPGQIFGLQACLFRRSLYSVATITEASLSSIPLCMIDDALERNPKLSKAMFWSAICEAAILGEHVTNAARRSAYERISHLILELFVRLNAVGLTEGMTSLMPLTQELIGDALGLTTVHVNRTLRLAAR